MKTYLYILVVTIVIIMIKFDTSSASHVSYFYTPMDVIIFVPNSGTNISIRNMSNPAVPVWTGGPTYYADAILSTKLPEGYYLIASTDKISILVGDVVNAGDGYSRGYYALDPEGNPCSTKIFTYIKKNSDTGEPVLIVFSCQDSNDVKISKKGEFASYSELWKGKINKGCHYLFKASYDMKIRITSEFPVSALVTGSEFQCNPASYSIPSTCGNFYGNEFYTFLPGGTLCCFAYEESTTIDLYNTNSGIKIGSWNLAKYEKLEQNIPFTPNNSYYFTIKSSKSITANRIFKGDQNFGIHNIADRSGTLIGTEFVFNAISPVEIYGFEDATEVEFLPTQGGISTYMLNNGGNQSIKSNSIFPDISGRVISNKAISLISISKKGASFIPFPYSVLNTVPGPPAIFAVRHFPWQPTTEDQKVIINWATDEPCLSTLFYRVNSDPWNTMIADKTYEIQHEIYLDISNYKANDKIEYYISVTDKDNYIAFNNNNSKYYNFTISPYIPKLSVGRISVQPPYQDCGAYTVNLLVENNGTDEAKKVEIRENLSGLISSSNNCSILPINDYDCEIVISVPNIPPNESHIVSYKLVPILYDTYTTYGISLNKPSSIVYQSSIGTVYNDNFFISELFVSPDVIDQIKKKDYVIATSTSRLMDKFNLINTGKILKEAAIFSLARNGVIACLEDYDRQKIEKLIDTNWNLKLNKIGYVDGWKYLLLLGRIDIIPSWHIQESCPFYEREAPVADNVYADVKEGDDFIPELIVGRMPGRDPNKLIQQIKKSLTPVKTTKAILISGTGNAQDDFIDCINGLEKILPNYTTKIVKHWKDVSNPKDEFKLDAIGTDLVVYRDHGWITSWNSKINLEDIGGSNGINFGGSNPIIWSIACRTGDIREHCLTDAFLEESSASVFIGSTHKSGRSPNNDFAKYLAIFHNNPSFGGKSIGGTFKMAKWKLIHENINWYSTCYADIRNKQIVNEYNLYGDPKRGLPQNKSICAINQPEFNLGESYSGFNIYQMIDNNFIGINHCLKIPTDIDNDMCFYYGANQNFLYTGNNEKFALEYDQNEEQIQEKSNKNNLVEYKEPPSIIEIHIPDCQVKTINSYDHVSIIGPNGEATYKEHNEPIIPTYIHKEYISAKYKIKDVILKARPDPEIIKGLKLPIASFEDDYAIQIKSEEDDNNLFPNEKNKFGWKIYEEIDGNQLLILTVLPFYYNKKTTNAKFYRDYTFEIKYNLSFVSIEDISLDQNDSLKNKTMVTNIVLNNKSQNEIFVKLKTEILNNNLNVLDSIKHAENYLLKPGITSVSIILDIEKYRGEYYYIRETAYNNDDLYDKESKRFRISDKIVRNIDLQIKPHTDEGFNIGDTIGIYTNFQNGGVEPIEGLATIQIFSNETSDIIKEWINDTLLIPNIETKYKVDWNTMGQKEGSYKISTFIQYDGKTSNLLYHDISTKQDLIIQVQTEKDTFRLGEKAVITWKFLNSLNVPVQNVNFSIELIKPDDEYSSLEYNYYSLFDYYVSRFYIFHNFPKGIYKIKISANKTGYHPISNIKSIIVL